MSPEIVFFFCFTFIYFLFYLMCITIQILVSKIFNVFERSLLCSPMLHLFDQNIVKTVILLNIIAI